MPGSLWSKFRYTSPLECIIDTNIRVFDITAANISILTDSGNLEPDVYGRLCHVDKMDREILIGKLIGDHPEIGEVLRNGILEAKKIFFAMNSIEDDEVLEIDNDSVTIIGTRPIDHLKIFNHTFFREDAVFSSYYRIKSTKYLYYCNRVNRFESLKVKGISNQALAFHALYMIDFLKELFFTAQFDGIQKALYLLSSFYNSYISKGLPIEYYRTLDSRSVFELQNFDRYGRFSMLNVPMPNQRRLIDISYNEKILRELSRMLSSQYFIKMK